MQQKSVAARRQLRSRSCPGAELTNCDTGSQITAQPFSTCRRSKPSCCTGPSVTPALGALGAAAQLGQTTRALCLILHADHHQTRHTSTALLAYDHRPVADSVLPATCHGQEPSVLPATCSVVAASSGIHTWRTGQITSQAEASSAAMHMLLAPPPAADVAEYHAKVVQAIGAGVEVRDAGSGRGKGIFATQSFEPGDVIFRERALVSQQDRDSCQQLQACTHCHRFVGSVEVQVARLLAYVAAKGRKLREKQQQREARKAGAGSSSQTAPHHVAGSSSGSQQAATAQHQEDEDCTDESEDEDEEEWQHRYQLGSALHVASKHLQMLRPCIYGGVQLAHGHVVLLHAVAVTDVALAACRKVPCLHAFMQFEAFAGEELLNRLAAGHIQLPFSERMPLPQPVYCRYGCGQHYCSQSCSDAAWEHGHCLLCPGSSNSTGSRYNGGIPSTHNAGASSSTSVTAQQATIDTNDTSNTNDAVSGSAASVTAQQATDHPTCSCSPQAVPPDTVYGMTVRRDLLPAFFNHAAETNDIFRLAAQLVASVAVKAACALMDGLQAPAVLQVTKGVQDMCKAVAQGEAVSGQAAVDPQAAQQSAAQQERSSAAAAALAAAWLPYAVGWKKAWWESVAVPDDVDDEQDFRQQLRELANDSLTLLRAALPGVVSSWPELLQLETWGNIIGTFELNNLGLAVPSPVEDYFLMVDELPEPERSTAKQQGAQQWLDALDKWYDTPVQGTGFYALQSCANHSCIPNAATEGEGDGRVSVYALEPIKPGQEITITYLDEPEDEPWSYKQRQAALRDYGFTCTCTRCEAEQAKRKRPGIKLGRR